MAKPYGLEKSTVFVKQFCPLLCSFTLSAAQHTGHGHGQSARSAAGFALLRRVERAQSSQP
ncbi:MAG TPA: hypothetical protein VIV60_33790, partial [Polyangiaceae bacterium]